MNRREIILSLIRPYLHWECEPLGGKRFRLSVEFVRDGRFVHADYQVQFKTEGMSRNAFALVVEGAENAVLSEMLK